MRFLGLTRIGGNHAPEMQDEINKPIFVVGSPRSGTSILSWCLGQHPNMLAVEQSGWMGDLAVDLAIRYQIGTALGDRSVLSAMDIQREEFFATFGNTINDLLLRHRIDLERKRWECAARAVPNAAPKNFTTAQSEINPKARWVDSTPLYSFYICGLRKLFPEALFIHIVRDVTSVVRSMLNFRGAAGESWVANEQAAYNYWLGAVSSCLLAERAYGPHIVFRLRYSDFVNAPEVALRSLLNFLGEPYAPKCLTPLQERINSSNVPADFKIGDPRTDPAIVEQATRLYAEIEETPQPPKPSPVAAQEIEAAFDARVQYITGLQARAERLAKNVAGKRAVIKHLRTPKLVRARRRLRECLFRLSKTLGNTQG